MKDDTPFDWDSAIGDGVPPDANDATTDDKASPDHGGWFPLSKRDLRTITNAEPEHAGRNLLVWAIVCSEANRVHSGRVTLTRAQIGKAAGLSARSACRALQSLASVRLLRYDPNGFDKAQGKRRPSTITLRATVPPYAPAVTHSASGDAYPLCVTERGASVAQLLTTPTGYRRGVAKRSAKPSRAAPAFRGPREDSRSVEEDELPVGVMRRPNREVRQ